MPNLDQTQTKCDSHKIQQVIHDLLQDFGTQIFHWSDYQKAVRDVNGVPGKFVTPAVGEWISGLRLTKKNNTLHIIRYSLSLLPTKSNKIKLLYTNKLPTFTELAKDCPLTGPIQWRAV